MKNQSVHFSCLVMSDSLRPHGLLHARFPYPSPTPGAWSKSCPSSWWCHPTISSSVPLLSPSPSTFNLSQHQGLFKWGSFCIRWPKYWSFSFNISPSNEHPGLIWFRMGWLDLLAVQGTLKSFLQHHSSKASIILRSAIFIVQLSHPYMTTGKTITLLERRAYELFPWGPRSKIIVEYQRLSSKGHVWRTEWKRSTQMIQFRASSRE